MKIAILAPHLKNAGGNRVLFSYANELVARGHRVTVYTRSKNIFRRTIANLLQIGKPLWVPLRARVVRVPRWEKACIEKYDHVIAGGYQEANALASWGSERGVGWYMIQHDEGLYHGPRDEVDRALRSDLKKIVVSSWLQDVVRERAGQESELLLNPYDRAQFFPTETVRILILDHSYEWKGAAEGIRQVRALQKKYPQIVLVGLGRRRIEAASLYDEYHFDPPQNDLQKIYAGADIFLCTSWDEGFGLPSLEAMACGTAVVTYDNGGSRDFALDADTAFVAPRRDEVALAQKLEEAIEDSPKRVRIAARGRVYVESMPTWKVQAEKLESILKRYE